ncbi:trypsin-like serine protease, partial [Cellulomonas septica]
LALACVGVPAAFAVQGTTPTGPTAAATVRLEIGADRACSGALLGPWWVLTAASCFTDPAGGALVEGRPTQPTKATVGRVDLTGTAGRVLGVDLLVPHPDHDVVLARLSAPVGDVAAVKVATAAPVVGEALTVTGYGRTGIDLVPDTAHVATFTVGAVAGGTIDLEAQSAGATICKGDAGGPTLRTTSSGVELVAIHHTAYQGGCLGSTATKQAATETRVDTLAGWITQNTVKSCGPTPAPAPAQQPVADGQLIRTPNGTISIVAGGAKYGLSYAQWAAMGLRGYTDVSDATAATLVDVPRDGTFLRNPADGGIYKIVSGTRYRLSATEWQALGSPGYTDVPVEFINRAPDAAAGGPALLRDPANGSIYQVVGCSRYPLTLAQWQALGSPPYQPAPAGLISRIPTGVPTEPALLRDRTDGGIYQVAGTAKYRLSMAEWQALGSKPYTEVPPALLAQVTRTIPTRHVLLRNASTGEIFQVVGGAKRKLSSEQWLAMDDRTYVDVPVGWLGAIPSW